jgi:colicin import membrane protein
MDVSKEIRDRIYAAADALYDQAGRTGFPTVDAVRREAKVSMNDANAVMRDWRKAQSAKMAPATVQVPDALQLAHGAALASLWQQAQEVANEGLRVAQAGWEAERAEAETLNREMADAYEAQSAELEKTHARIAELEANARRLEDMREAQRRMVEASQAELVQTQQRAAAAEVRVAELRSELEHARDEAGQMRAERDKAIDQSISVARKSETIKAEAVGAASRLRVIEANAGELRSALDQAGGERDAAREEAAMLRGRLSALESLLPLAKAKTGKAAQGKEASPK